MRAYQFARNLLYTDTLFNILVSILLKQAVRDNRFGALFVGRDPANCSLLRL